jgi:2'-5' RNA ligase
MRLFVAIDLSYIIRKALSDQINIFIESLGTTSVRWVKPSGIHLTLKFLEETPDHKVDQIKDSLGEISSRFSPFMMRIGTFGTFPNSRRPRVLWVGIQEPTGILKQVHQEIELGFQQIGFKAENRPFTPHLTVGRIKKNLSSDALSSLGSKIGDIRIGELGTETVEEISLIRSVLRPTGAEYSRLGAFEFMEEKK